MSTRRIRVQHNFDESDMSEYYGDAEVWKLCSGSGEAGRDTTNPLTFKRTGARRFSCRSCYLTLDSSDTAEGEAFLLPEHEVRMDIYEQAEEKIGALAETLGFDRWGDVTLEARVTATNRQRRGPHTVEGMVAVGMDVLQRALITRSAVKQATLAIDALTSFRLASNDWISEVGEIHGYEREEVSDDAPFFSEAVLYPLLGKEDARTVLAYVKNAGAALAATREKGIE